MRDLSWIKSLIISPPFGNRVPDSHHYTRIMGTYTREPRKGWFGQVLRTLRPIPGGWVNRIGLRNPGLSRVKFQADRIYSIAGFSGQDWLHMLTLIESWADEPPVIELNLSCPNVHEYNINPSDLKILCGALPIIAKLPPGFPSGYPDVDRLADLCMEAGACLLHCSNTIPVARGGESGLRLFSINLPIVERLAKRYPDKIIAGGGVYYPEQVRAYRNAGAKHISISSVFFTPWRIPQIIKHIEKD